MSFLINLSVLGNSYGEFWYGKYELDRVGNYIIENGQKKISQLYDPNREYIPRSQRPEWNVVGFLGIVRILKNKPVAPNWTKLYSINPEFDAYFIR